MDLFDFCIIILFLVMVALTAIVNPAFIPYAIVVGGPVVIMLIVALFSKCVYVAHKKKEIEKEALKLELMLYIDNKISDKEEMNDGRRDD